MGGRRRSGGLHRQQLQKHGTEKGTKHTPASDG
jgi:hypothetical protein